MDGWTKVIYRVLIVGCWVTLVASAIDLYASWIHDVVVANYWTLIVVGNLAVMVALFLARVGFGLVRRLQSVKR